MKTIKVISALLGIISFLFYQYEFVRSGIKPNELYFIASSLCISIFIYLAIDKDDSTFVKSILFLSGTFFLAVLYIFIRRWIMEGDGSTNYYTALCVSAVFTLIYLVFQTAYYIFYGRK